MTGPEFQNIRHQIKLTMPELARALRVTVQAVQNWDAGRRSAPGPVVVVMRAAHEIPAMAARLRRLAKAERNANP
jgi:DNA-binding transcriptional regulator YiaG